MYGDELRQKNVAVKFLTKIAYRSVFLKELVMKNTIYFASRLFILKRIYADLLFIGLTKYTEI